MTFYLYKEWVDTADGIEKVLLHYAVAHIGAQPDWVHNARTREMHPDQRHGARRRSKVIKLPRNLDGNENYNLHYKYQVLGAREWETEPQVSEIVCDSSFKFVDYDGQYTNVCVYWSIDGWDAPNYSTMFEEGTDLDNPLSSLHFYGRTTDREYLGARYRMLQEKPLPHVYWGRVHAPRGSRVFYCFHILRKGAPDGQEWDFWDNNQGLNYWRDIR